jgi:hypothetical protein
MWLRIRSIIEWNRFSMFLPVFADTSKWLASNFCAYCSPSFFAMHFSSKSTLFPAISQHIPTNTFIDSAHLLS